MTDPITEADLQHNATLVRRFIDEIWGGRHPAHAERFFAEDFKDTTYSPPTAEGHMAMVQVLRGAIPDAQWTIEQLVCQNDEVVCRLRLKGRHLGQFRAVPASGNAVDVLQYRSFRIANGRLVEHCALFDTSRFLEQIGAEPFKATVGPQPVAQEPSRESKAP